MSGGGLKMVRLCSKEWSFMDRLYSWQILVQVKNWVKRSLVYLVKPVNLDVISLVEKPS
jgi:hypothetical protein